MAEPAQEVRHVNWRDVFGFTLIFNSFRLSRHATKLLIALAAVLLTWGGGRLLDAIFTPFSNIYQVRGSLEPQAYPETNSFREAAADRVYLELDLKKAKYGLQDSVDKQPSQMAKLLDKIRRRADDRYEKAVAAAKGDEALRAVHDDRVKELRELDGLERKGPFETLIAYERGHFKSAVLATVEGRFVNGIARVWEPESPTGEEGMLYHVGRMLVGLTWMFQNHWIFGTIFTLVLLVIWAFAGGAIARAAALQATRDEKAGFRECIGFAYRKFFSFLASPLVPLAVFVILLVLPGILFAAPGGLPHVGGIWIGVWFGGVLAVSFLLAWLLIGLVGGGMLMAPTIAVEGSDTFDACTRSYQFVLARPWRALLYGIVAAVYGAICYVFVRTLLFLTLLVSKWMVGVWTGYTYGDAVRAGADKWDLMWQGPTWDSFRGAGISPVGLRGGDMVGAWIVWLWVSLVAAALVAWMVSFLISAATDIYLLLRKAEDATDVNEVYVKEPEEEEAEVEPKAAEEKPVESAAPAPSVEPPATEPSAEPKTE